MSAVVELDDLSRNEILDRVDVLHTTARRGEAEVLVLAVQFAQLHGAFRTDLRGGKPLPGREGLKQLGGAGTPMVAEFAPVLLGARLALSPYAGASLVADALDLRYRLTRLWERVQNLEVKASYAREVARKTRHLAKAHAAQVDEAVAEEADGRLPWTRFLELLDASIITTDPATAAQREQEAASRYAAAPTRSNDYGMRGFFVHAPFPVIARLDATVTYLAQALSDFGDTSALDERRVKAVLILANPTQAVQVLRAYAAWRAQQKQTAHDATADETVPDRELDGEGLHPTDREPPALADPQLDGQQRSHPVERVRAVAADRRLVRPQRSRPARRRALPCPDPELDAPSPSPADREPSRLPDPKFDGQEEFNPADVEPAPPSTPTFDDTDLLPAVRLFVHLAQDTIENDCTSGVARVKGQPPITAQWIKQHLGGCRITVTPVIDLAHQIPVDAWEIPQRHRHAVHFMTPADTFPFATNTTRGKQIDHTIPYDRHGPPGQSRIGNYGPMTVFHHRLKTHGGWHVVQPFPGIYLWRDPTQTATYIVDHTGTRRVEAG